MDYAKLARIADGVLRKHGSTATLKRASSSTYNPATSSSTVTEASSTVRVVVFAYPIKLVDGTMIKMGDQQAIMSAVGITIPSPGDRLTWQGSDHTIVSVKEIAPDGTVVLYELQVRK